MTKPQYSIIIPALNEEKFLPNLLLSLTKQTNKSFETIVVDGQSKDRTVRVANSFKKSLSDLTVTSCPRGVSRQRNTGVKLAKTRWIVLIDADSVLLPNFIERIGAFIKEKQPVCFTTWFETNIDTPHYAILGLIINIGVEATLLTKKPWLPGPLVLIRKDVFLSIGGYNEDVVYGEDHEIGIELARHGYSMDILREVLYIYSMRRFQKEGILKVINRTIKSDAMIAFANTGLKKMPGFVSGDSLYEKQTKKKKNLRIISKKLERDIRQFAKELVQ